MPSLTDLLTRKKTKVTPPVLAAHFIDPQFVHPKLGWAEAAAALCEALPKDTRPERPAPWYSRLRDTHWAGCIPPGNGPFYLPEHVFADAPAEVMKKYEQILKKLGFRTVQAHALYLPEDSEYLHVIMRAAKATRGCAWNANPITYRGYLYPAMDGATRPLRPYTTARFVLTAPAR